MNKPMVKIAQIATSTAKVVTGALKQEVMNTEAMNSSDVNVNAFMIVGLVVIELVVRLVCCSPT